MATARELVPHPPGRGIRKAASYAPRRVQEALSEFRRLNSREARAAFADHWIGLWASEFDDAWPMLYELLAIVKDDELYRDSRRVGPAAAGKAHGQASEYRDFAAYFEDRVKRPFMTWAELEKAHRFVQDYAPELQEKPLPVVQRAMAIDGWTVNSGDGPLTQEELSNGDIITVNETGKGTSADYLTRRIARDHPEVFERMKAGEFPSVRAAALEAGIAPRTQSVRIDDPDSAARTLRKHMAPEDLAALVELLVEDSDLIRLAAALTRHLDPAALARLRDLLA